MASAPQPAWATTARSWTRGDAAQPGSPFASAKHISNHLSETSIKMVGDPAFFRVVYVLEECKTRNLDSSLVKVFF